METKVSVVVPVYNAEKYLKICVHSICNQTYKNLEIILVDDGAKDNSPQICDELQKSDERIIVIHKENEGAGKSRNCGIEVATGEYILFVDSDDYIKPTLIEKCVRAVDGSKVAMVMFGVENITESGYRINDIVPYSEQYIFLEEEVLEKVLPELLFSEKKSERNLEIPACMANFYSMDIIKKTSWHFESEREYISEDLYSLLKLYPYIKRFIVLNEALYCYRHGQESLSSSSRLMDYSLIKKFYKQCVYICKENHYNEKVLHNISEPYLSFTIACLKLKVKQKKNILEVNRELDEILCDEQLYEVLSQRDLSKEKKTKRILYRTILNKHYLITKILIDFKYLGGYYYGRHLEFKLY